MKLLAVCQHTPNFGDYGHFNGGDLITSIYHVTLHNHVLCVVCDFMDGRPHLGGHWSSAILRDWRIM